MEDFSIGMGDKESICPLWPLFLFCTLQLGEEITMNTPKVIERNNYICKCTFFALVLVGNHFCDIDWLENLHVDSGFVESVFNIVFFHTITTNYLLSHG